MDLGRIKDLIDLMNRHQLEELEIEEGGFKVRMRKRDERVEVQKVSPHAPVAGSSAEPAVSSPTGVQGKEGTFVRSPMVGTFYRAPSPEAGPFVEVGDRVEPDTVLCVIEAMKVMNDVKAEINGVINEILVENGDSVEFGQPLFRL